MLFSKHLLSQFCCFYFPIFTRLVKTWVKTFCWVKRRGSWPVSKHAQNTITPRGLSQSEGRVKSKPLNWRLWHDVHCFYQYRQVLCELNLLISRKRLSDHAAVGLTLTARVLGNFASFISVISSFVDLSLPQSLTASPYFNSPLFTSLDRPWPKISPVFFFELHYRVER